MLLDVVTEDPYRYQWSSTALAIAARTASLFINPLIYAEVSMNYDTIEELDETLPEHSFRRVPEMHSVTNFPTVEIPAPVSN